MYLKERGKTRSTCQLQLDFLLEFVRIDLTGCVVQELLKTLNLTLVLLVFPLTES